MIIQKTVIANGINYSVNVCTLQTNKWVLIYKDKKVIELKQNLQNCTLETILNVFIADTKEACLAEITRLNLEYVDVTLTPALSSETKDIFSLLKNQSK